MTIVYFLKRVILWYGMESMVCYEIAMLYAMIFLCYAKVYVVKDKHSATILDQRSQFHGLSLGGKLDFYLLHLKSI